MRTKFEREITCIHCGKLEVNHFDGYCEKPKVECISPMRDSELLEVFNAAQHYSTSIRAIANASRKQTVLEICARRAVNGAATSISDAELYHLQLEYKNPIMKYRCIANAAIARFFSDLKTDMGCDDE